MKKKSEDLLTVKEFAEVAGVSRQAVYSQLTRKLAEYVKVIDNRKYIESTALEVYPVNKGDNEVDKSVKNPFTKLPTVDELADQEEELYNEQLIAELNARIESLERDKERLYTLLEEKEKSLQQAQTLHLQTQGVSLLEEEIPSPEERQNRGFFSRFRRRK